MVPLTVREDSAPASKTTSFDSKSFSGLLGQGDEKLCKYPCSTVVSAKGVVDRSWSVLLKDFEELGTGVVGGRTVAQDPDGTI
eukprot:3287454-Lingulodinium_polyedra.AAC.1